MPQNNVTVGHLDLCVLLPGIRDRFRAPGQVKSGRSAVSGQQGALILRLHVRLGWGALILGWTFGFSGYP